MEDLNTRAGFDRRPGTNAVPNFPLRYTLNRISKCTLLRFPDNFIRTFVIDCKIRLYVSAIAWFCNGAIVNAPLVVLIVLIWS